MTMAGALFPYFGRAFSLFGIHNRVIGLLLLFVSSVLATRRFHLKDASKTAAGLCLLFSLLMLIFANSQQVAQVFELDFSPNYYQGKLAIFVQCSLPVMAAGFALSPFCHFPDFRRGMVYCIMALAVVGLIIFAQSSEYWVGQTYQKFQEFGKLESFSSISLSLIMTLGFVCALLQFRNAKVMMRIALVIFMLALILGILLLRQRAHAIFLGFLMLVVTLKANQMRNKNIFLVITFLTAVYFAFSYFPFLFGDTFHNYWRFVAEGHLFDTRGEMFRFALNGSLNNPFGHGLGGFLLDYPGQERYPHNNLLESFYELGLFGLLILGALYYLGVKGFLTNLYKSRAGLENDHLMALAYCAVFVIAHTLKAGTISNMDMVVFFILVTSHVHMSQAEPSPVPETQRSRYPVFPPLVPIIASGPATARGLGGRRGPVFAPVSPALTAGQEGLQEPIDPKPFPKSEPF